MKICFIIGSPDIGGGTYVIFQHALFLKLNGGNEVDIVPIFPATDDNLKWHPEAKDHLRFMSFEEAANEYYDVVILTWWKTVLEAYRVNGDRYVYFVQSIESFFYPESEQALRKLVDSTYTFDLPVITEATWIKNYLYHNYSTHSWLVFNGIRKDIYRPYGTKTEKPAGNSLRVLVEGPIEVGFKNVPKTIELCRKSLADEVWLLTSSNVSSYPGVDRVFSRVPITDTPAIYRSCDVIVKLSYVEGMFGPPLEMFHCGGTAIVYKVTGHNEYILHTINGFAAEKDDDKKIIEFINLLKKNPDLLREMKYEALKTAHDWPDWAESSSEFQWSVNDICQTTGLTNKEEFFQNAKVSFSKYVEEEEYKKSLAK
jgi:O-antigen biosynthesis protein